jgi:hypothetical protein
MRFTKLTVLILLVSAIALAIPAQAQPNPGKIPTVRALEKPELIAPGTDDVARERMINEVGKVGANTVCFDLVGFSDDGTSIDPKVVENLDHAMSNLKYRGMRAMCRVNSPDAPTGFWASRKAAKTAVEVLKKYPEILCWMDGPKSRVYIRAFNRDARKMNTIAKQGSAKLWVVDDERKTGGTRFVVYGTVPESNKVHCIMPPTPESDAAYIDANRYPGELEPWEPDNSILSEEERAEGFIALFDGKTLNGWSIAPGGDPYGFLPSGDTIAWVRKGGQYLTTTRQYGDFILRMEYNQPEGGNSGIHIRAPRAGRASKLGFEFQMMGDYGEEPHKNGTGAVYDVLPPTENAVRPNGEWNTMEIVLQGTKYKAMLNGVVIHDIDFNDHDLLKPRLQEGFIRLTDHDHPVFFRNIRLKKL